ncbi:MAG TPA: DUF4352 domain-containing protein [Bryobacteraceae bacterium]|nr:DUF4352 domain-containing protein [Bryobacteraceae bacterium]
MRNFTYSLLLATLVLGLAGCSSDAPNPSDEARVVPAGEKATAGHLTYSVLDSQILTEAGDGDSPRVPIDRFIVVQIAVNNTGNSDASIPAVTLEGDSGNTYNELTDGTGIPNFLGVLRHVGPGQTTRGTLAFDAPAAHYRLRFADENDGNEILADLPLTYTHEKINNSIIPTTDPDLTGAGNASGATAPASAPATK